jgi:hypothetical protein
VEILKNVLVVLHFVGLASLLGGVLVQIRSFKTGTAVVLPAIMHGAWTQLVTGIALVGVIEMGDFYDSNNAKVAVKLAVVVVIVAVGFLNRKNKRPAAWVVPAIGALALVNTVIAVFWR